MENVILCKRCGAEAQTWAGRCPVCGGTEAVSVAPQEDKLLGRTIHQRFKLVRKLGQGGMGTVYEAFDLKLGQKAALKFLNPDSQSVDLAKRFLAEARTVARVQHPGAVSLLDFGQEDDGTLFIALEYVDGLTLKSLLDERRRLPPGEAVDIILQVAGALGHAHSLGVVHRDLKPENVMVKAGLHGYHVKLLDLGVARRTYAGATQLTQRGAVAGTPRYMAPEQVRGEDIDGRVDIYALALLTFELLTGVPAMDAPDLDAMLAQQLRGGVRTLGSVDPALHNPALDAVLSKATSKDRDHRYGTMATFAEALKQAIGHAPSPWVMPSVPPPREPPRPPLATPYVAPLIEPASKREWLTWVLIALGLGIAGTALGLARRYVMNAATTPIVAGGACPGTELYDPALRDLDTAELERQVATLPIYMPSVARRQLDTLKAQTENYAPERRACMYRSMLLGSVSSARTVLKTQPALWGHTRDVGRLRSLFLEMPLKQPWTTEQRSHLLDTIDTLFIANLKAEDDADRDFWRRQYYGIELLCEATDDTLRELHAQRPSDCLNLTP